MSLSDNLRQQTRRLTTKELTYLLRLRRTVCDWIACGKLPAVRTSGGYRFDPVSIEDWLDARAIGLHRRSA